MRWQDISKILAGMSTVGVVGLFAYLFLLTGMDYIHSGDSNCTYIDDVYQCPAYINLTTKYWNFEFEYLSSETYIYLPEDLKTFTGKLTRYRAGDLDFEPVLYKKSTRGRKLWINLNMIDNIIDTQPEVKVDWLVPARGKDNWRLVKEGDTWDRLKNNRIKLVGYPENTYVDIKWSFLVGEIDIDPIWFALDKIHLKDAKVEIKDKKIKNKVTKEIKFSNLKRDFNIKEEAEKVGKTAKDYMNVKKTNYYGDVDIKLMHYKNVTINQSYSCNCYNETNVSINGTKTIKLICDTCYKDVVNEVFQEIDPETYVLKNDEPIYEIMSKSTKFEKMENGWGHSVWTDVNIMGIEIEGATWWNETFQRRKPIEINISENVTNYQFNINITHDIDMLDNHIDLRFADTSNTILSYWKEFSTDSEYAYVWVKGNATNLNGTQMYMYYKNNTEISDVSDITSTMNWSENWNTLDWTSTWQSTDHSIYSVSDGILSMVNADASTKYIESQSQSYGTGSHVWGIKMKNGTVSSSSMAYIMRSNTQGGAFDNGKRLDVIGIASSGGNWTWQYRKTNNALSSVLSTFYNYDEDKWFTFRVYRIGANSMEYESYSDNTLKHRSSTYSDYKDEVNYERSFGWGGSLFYIDHIYVAELIEPEPTYAFGTEEVSTSAPTFSSNSHNSTYSREESLHTIYISSSGTLDSGIFSFDNGTGTFINDTVNNSLSGSDIWFNNIKTLNYTIGSTIRWIVYANSTDGDLGTSSTYTYDTIGHMQGTVTDADTSNTVAGVTIWIIDNSDNSTYAITETDVNGDWEYDMTVIGTYHIVASKNSTYKGDVKNDITVS